MSSDVPAAGQKPLCPVCNQADQVMTTQAAYDSGIGRCAPPDMPTQKVLMMPYIGGSAVFVGICIILIIVLIGSEANIGVVVESIIIALTLISILTALGLAYYAFQRVVAGDAVATERYEAWDRAMAVWRSLYYCKRDDVVFDPKSNSVLTAEQVKALRTMEEGVAEAVTAKIAQAQTQAQAQSA
jgi:hypothetical protein